MKHLIGTKFVIMAAAFCLQVPLASANADLAKSLFQATKASGVARVTQQVAVTSKGVKIEVEAISGEVGGKMKRTSLSSGPGPMDSTETYQEPAFSRGAIIVRMRKQLTPEQANIARIGQHPDAHEADQDLLTKTLDYVFEGATAYVNGAIDKAGFKRASSRGWDRTVGDVATVTYMFHAGDLDLKTVETLVFHLSNIR